MICNILEKPPALGSITCTVSCCSKSKNAEHKGNEELFLLLILLHKPNSES